MLDQLGQRVNDHGHLIFVQDFEHDLLPSLAHDFSANAAANAIRGPPDGTVVNNSLTYFDFFEIHWKNSFARHRPARLSGRKGHAALVVVCV